MATLWRIWQPSRTHAFDRLQNAGLHHVALLVNSREKLQDI